MRLRLFATFRKATVIAWCTTFIVTAHPSKCVDDICDSDNMAKRQAVKMVMPQPRAHWVGDGFNVFPLFNNMAFQKEMSPWLMFDYAAPKLFPKTAKKLGVGMHPHRGFETVTIALQGEIEHRDNQGNTGVIGTGDIQWMTAGKGIFHEEFHSKKFRSEGGTLEMMQLWVNLPAKLKMVDPRYQAILAKDIVEVPLPNGAGSVRVMAGTFGGKNGPAKTDFDDEKGSPRGRGYLDLWEIKLKKGKKFDVPRPDGHTTILFVRLGGVALNDETPLPLHRVALFERKGTSVSLEAQEDSSVFLLGGAPHFDKNGEVEPIASYGPMVMNTQQEIREAMQWAYTQQVPDDD